MPSGIRQPLLQPSFSIRCYYRHGERAEPSIFSKQEVQMENIVISSVLAFIIITMLACGPSISFVWLAYRFMRSLALVTPEALPEARSTLRKIRIASYGGFSWLFFAALPHFYWKSGELTLTLAYYSVGIITAALNYEYHQRSERKLITIN